MSAQSVSVSSQQAASIPLGIISTSNSQADEDSLNREGMRWLQENLKLPTGLACCHRIPKSNSSLTYTHKSKKDFTNRNTVKVKDFGTSSGLCTCNDSPHCLIHAHVKQDLNEQFINTAIGNTEFKYRFLMATFTVAHSYHNSLDELTAVLTKAFTELKRRAIWKKSFGGTKPIWAIRKLEVTRSLIHGYHPHLHVEVAVDTGCDIDDIQKKLVKNWKQIISMLIPDGYEPLEKLNKQGEWVRSRYGGRLKVRVMSKEELENGRSPYSVSTKHGVNVREIPRGSEDEKYMASYLAKGISKEIAADFTKKSGRQALSFSIPEIIYHVSGLRINKKIESWEDEQDWKTHGVRTPFGYWKNELEEYFTSMSGREVYSYTDRFKEFAEMDKDRNKDKMLLKNEDTVRDHGSVFIPDTVAKKLSRGNGILRFNWFYKNPDLQKLLNQIQKMVSTDDFKKVELLTPEEKTRLHMPQKPEKPTAGGIESQSVYVWKELKKSKDNRTGWIKLSDWEEALMNSGIKIRDANGITCISIYKQQTVGFEFKVFNKIPMLRYTGELITDAVFPKLGEDNFLRLESQQTNGLKQAA
jgi:hypothetical protein